MYTAFHKTVYGPDGFVVERLTIQDARRFAAMMNELKGDNGATIPNAG